jgi:hypothetical protein
MKFSNCLAISFTNFARLIICGFPWKPTVLIWGVV